jgi:hypothetical protein
MEYRLSKSFLKSYTELVHVTKGMCQL